MVVDSRVKKGRLVLAGQEFSCQPTAVSIAPENEGEESETLEVLCGDTLNSITPGVLTANLTMTAVQDFTAASGSLIGYSWSTNNTVVPFTWQPTEDADDAWTGTVMVQAVEVGGEVNKRLDTEAEWPIKSLQMPTKLGGKWVIGGSPVAITGVAAGTPGAFEPSNATLPADLAALKADPVVGDAGSNKPAGAWTTGQFVILGDASHAHYGTAWAAGEAP